MVIHFQYLVFMFALANEAILCSIIHECEKSDARFKHL